MRPATPIRASSTGTPTGSLHVPLSTPASTVTGVSLLPGVSAGGSSTTWVGSRASIVPIPTKGISVPKSGDVGSSVALTRAASMAVRTAVPSPILSWRLARSAALVALISTGRSKTNCEGS